MQRATSFGYAFKVLSPYYPVFSETMWAGSLKILPNLLPGLVHFMHFSKKIVAFTIFAVFQIAFFVLPSPSLQKLN